MAWITEESPGSSDREILSRAAHEKRIVLTFDNRDFGQLAFHAKLPSEAGIVLFVMTTESPEWIAEKEVQALESRGDWDGHFSVIEEQRIRMFALYKK